ncbi:hypothetical protein M405DRAFT_830698 [Rhizopogon salebrosus TDB-379]|nr:hypothetical protein M405DRAFT_830698 [Rhizopogon salebrosus TDB-379]
MALSLVQMKAAASVVQVMAIALTVFRVWFRLYIRRFWWEDAFAVSAGLFAVAKMITSWILLNSKGTTAAVAFWITTFMFPCITWSARMSILLSITRIARPTRWLFRFSLGFATIFSLMWAGSMVQRALTCDYSDKPSPVNHTAPFCNIYGSTAVYEVTISCVADAMLVAFSFRLLWNLNLPTRQRRMIRIIFSSGIIMSLFSLFHAATNFVSSIAGIATVAVNLETSSSLIICNLLVIVTCAYRVLNRKSNEDPEDDDYSSRTQAVSTSQQLATINPSATSQQLTTVDLAISAETYASSTRV